MNEHQSLQAARALTIRRVCRVGPLAPDLLLEVEDLTAYALRNYEREIVFDLIYAIMKEDDLRLLRPLAKLAYH